MDALDRPGKTTVELDALDETRLIEVPVPELSDIDHDAHGGWPQYAEGYEFDHTGEEVADPDLVAADRAERGLDH